MMKISKLLTLPLKSQGIKQSFLTVAGNGVGTLFSAAALMIISRQLGPTMFGEFSVGFAIVLILTKLNELGMNNVIVKFANIDKSTAYNNQIFRLVLKYRLFVSAILMVLGILLAPTISTILNFSNSAIIVVAFTLGLITTYYEYLLTVFQSFQQFFSGVIINFIQASFKLLAALTVFALGVNNSTILFSLYVAAPATSLLGLPFLLPKGVNFINKVEQELPLKAIYRVAGHSSIALISAGIIENIDVLFVQSYLNTYEAGLYSGVSRIALLFSLVAYSIAGVLNVRVSRYKNNEHLRPYIIKALISVLGVIVAFALYLPFTKPLIFLTVGPEYISGLPQLIVLSAASFLAIASVPFIALFYSYKQDWYFSVSGLIQLTIMIVGNVMFVPIFGLDAAAWTRFATRLFLFVFTSLIGITIYKKEYAKRMVV